MNEQSLLLIKPNAVHHRHIGHIISIVEDRGFIIRNIKIFQFTPDSAREFYRDHRGKEFFERLVSFMISGPTVALLLEKKNAMAELRELVGDADPGKRNPDTIRSIYAEGITENAVHASDNMDSAYREINLIFGHRHST